MISTCIVELPGAMESSVAITADVLATANLINRHSDRPPPFAVERLRRAGPRQIAKAIEGVDLVIVPGLGIAMADQLDDRLNSMAVRQTAVALRHAAAAGATIAASCASTFLLAEAGVLDGRRATTSWWLAPVFQRRYPAVDLVPDQMVVADGPIVTGGAAMAQMDVMLILVAKFAGADLARRCAQYLLLDERRSQTPFMAMTYLTGQDRRIAQAETWVRDHIAEDFSMDDLAAAIAQTPRTFARRLAAVCGLSPVKFVQRIRIEMARVLLETTRLPVDEIARQVGYAEASTLRRLLRRETHRSPAMFRPRHRDDPSL